MSHRSRLQCQHEPALYDDLPVILLVIGLFAGIWLNRRDFSDLKTDTNRQVADLKADLKADMNRQFGTVNRGLKRSTVDSTALMAI